MSLKRINHGNENHTPGFVEDTGDIMTGPLSWQTVLKLNAINGDIDVIEYDAIGNLHIRCYLGKLISLYERVVLLKATTALAPPHIEGGLYYDTTLHKLQIGGAAAWETAISRNMDIQTLTGAGAVNLTNYITFLVTAGVDDAITLADGVEGQEKLIITKTETTGGDTSVLTPAHLRGFSTVTFDGVGESICLIFLDGAWSVKFGFRTTVA